MTAAEAGRRLVAKATRHTVGDLPGDTRRLAAALTASSSVRFPTLQWVVAGCRDENNGGLFVVSTNVGLGFIPALSELPDYTAVHVFAHSPDVDWGIKRGWLGNPLQAVLSWGRETGHNITVVAGRETALTQTPESVGREYVTDDILPSDHHIRGGRDRLYIVDPEASEWISTLSLSALADRLPVVEIEPDDRPGGRASMLWSDAVMATDVSDAFQIDTWQAFCADQAAASAHKVRRVCDDETKAREHFRDYQYFVWNLNELEAASAHV